MASESLLRIDLEQLKQRHTQLGGQAYMTARTAPEAVLEEEYANDDSDLMMIVVDSEESDGLLRR
jgi:hypothetical protein